ncbi:hypothetical protein LBMAG57_17660 [Verrucomicrobiota bacterium]|nr:hypothetical protein LBMAG57_17660 [Verrucomicrobiota bacterium]
MTGVELHRTQTWNNLCPMKLRTDLLKHLTADDIREEAEKAAHRFKPEPLLSKTGTGSLSPASTEERAREVEHSMELTRKLEARARQAGSGSAAP